MITYTDHFTWSEDGVRLHARIFGDRPQGLAIVCIPGLTRNLKDFDVLASHVAGRFPVVTLSLRGRGESGYADDPLTYVPLVYIRDVERVLNELKIDRMILVGTSLGGLVSILMEGVMPERIAGVILNDIGPEPEQEGLARIRAALGKGDNWPTWLHAARDLAEKQRAIYPDWSLEDWLAHTKRLCRLSREGRIIWDYDPGIAAPLSLPHADDALDLWPAFLKLEDLPILSIRGEVSDILSAAAQRRMQQRLPALRCATVPRVGHAPTLDEPEARDAIDAFLADPAFRPAG